MSCSLDGTQGWPKRYFRHALLQQVVGDGWTVLVQVSCGFADMVRSRDVRAAQIRISNTFLDERLMRACR